MENSTWRSNASGTPLAYYRRGEYIYLDRPIDSEADDIKVYAVLISDDFNNDDIAPYNQLTYLEPFHYAMVLYLKMRAKAKFGKKAQAASARAEYDAYVAWMKKEIGGGKYGKIYFRKKR